MTIHADLGPSLESFVSSLVASGRYASPEEVLREALRLFQEREARLAALDAAIERGLADAAEGRVKPAAEVFDALEAKFQAMADVKRP
jgi:antitoxin ParD1/3/4